MRVGVSRAASAVLTGQAWPVAKWAEAGLIEQTAPGQELEATLDRWFQTNFAPRSAAALRCAAIASRAAVRRHVDAVLPELEHLYLTTLMRTKDAVEGIAAFLEKRQPVWSDS
jgi:enoyl-CoA hydratase/carnithine racemase